MEDSITADLIPPRKSSWAWSDRIPRGGLTVIAAEARAGASIFVTDLAARASSGAGWPLHEWYTSKYRVVLFADEHDIVSARLSVKAAEKKRIALQPRLTSQQVSETLAGNPNVSVALVDDYLVLPEAGDSEAGCQGVNEKLRVLNEIARAQELAVLAVVKLSSYTALRAQQRAYLLRSRDLVSLVTLEKVGNSAVIRNPLACWGPAFPSLELIIQSAERGEVTAARAKYRNWVDPPPLVERSQNRTDRAIEFVANHFVDGMDSSTLFAIAAASGIKKGVMHIALDSHGVTRKRVGGRGSRGRWVLQKPKGWVLES